ncbi:MAG: hypothetical protein RR405_03525 [Clostridia bacterium]
MAYRKEIIIVSGGKNKGVVKLGDSVQRSGYLKGSCSVDFLPVDGTLYIVGDSIRDVALSSYDTAFEVEDCKGKDISCVIISKAQTLYGSTESGTKRGAILSRVEEFRHGNERKNIKINEKNSSVEANIKPNNAFERSKIEANVKPTNVFESRDINNKNREYNLGENKDINNKNRGYNLGENKDINNKNKGARIAETAFDSDIELSGIATKNAYVFDEGVRYDGKNFYLAVKPQIDEMFVCYPIEKKLTEAVPNSKWVHIDADDDFYVVGLLYDNEKPAFICYGIPGKYSIKPPSDLAEMCVWLPTNVEDKYGDGFWVIYQSAVDGTIVK